MRTRGGKGSQERGSRGSASIPQCEAGRELGPLLHSSLDENRRIVEHLCPRTLVEVTRI
jgi:hypothetical protein